MKSHRFFRYAARGIGLLQVLLLIGILSGLAAMGYLQWRERSATGLARQQHQTLAQAERAVAAFATVMRRLPCPDTDRDGAEDCAGGAQKGWLPSASLGLAGADAGVHAGQLRYLVQRGPGLGGAADLSALDDAWRPLAYDDQAQAFTGVQTSPYPNGILTLADLCQRLAQVRDTPHAPGMAEIRATPVRVPAYALVHPGGGDADGDGSVFDGVNADPALSAVEAPTRTPLLARYDDMVLERSPHSLLADFQCQPLLDSIHTVALALDVVEQVDELRVGHIASAKQAVAFAALGAAITAVETTGTVLEGISEAGNAAAAWALCAASLGLAVNACAAAPQHTAAIALVGGVVYANGVSIGLNITAAILAGKALALADSSVRAEDLTCPQADYTQALAAARQELNNARRERSDIAAQINSRQRSLRDAQGLRDSLIDMLRASLPQGDPRLPALLAAADLWEQRWMEQQTAQATRDHRQKAYDNWRAEVQRYTTLYNERPARLAQLQSEIAALRMQIDATTDAAAKAALQQQLGERLSQLSLLQDAAVLQKALNDAIAERDRAWAALQVARQALQNANQRLQAASQDYVAARNALSPFFDVYVMQLMGSLPDRPDLNAAYLRPLRLNREIRALQSRLGEAEQRITNAQALLTQLQTLADTPRPCNITGTGVTPMTPAQARDILVRVDQKGGMR